MSELLCTTPQFDHKSVQRSSDIDNDPAQAIGLRARGSGIGRSGGADSGGVHEVLVAVRDLLLSGDASDRRVALCSIFTNLVLAWENIVRAG